MDMQSVLGLDAASNTTDIIAQPPNLKKLSAATWSRLCGLICAYRLVDVIAMLGGCSPNELRVPRSPSQKQKQLYVRLPALSLGYSQTHFLTGNDEA